MKKWMSFEEYKKKVIPYREKGMTEHEALEQVKREKTEEKRKGFGKWEYHEMRGSDILNRCKDIEDAMIRVDIWGRSEKTAKPVFFVSTAHDPSVGIFGATISPYFKTQKKAQNYLRELQKKCFVNKKRRM